DRRARLLRQRALHRIPRGGDPSPPAERASRPVSRCRGGSDDRGLLRVRRSGGALPLSMGSGAIRTEQPLTRFRRRRPLHGGGGGARARRPDLARRRHPLQTRPGERATRTRLGGIAPRPADGRRRRDASRPRLAAPPSCRRRHSAAGGRQMSVTKIELAADVLQRSRGAALLRRAPAWSGVLVLNYHRIGHVATAPFFRDAFSATPADFDRQLAFLARNADVIAADDLPQALRSGRGRHVMITFDDGYLDNYELAFPLLRQHHLPATFFICTGLLD